MMPLDLTPAKAGEMIHTLDERLQVVEQGLIDAGKENHDRYQRLERMILDINEQVGILKTDNTRP